MTPDDPRHGTAAGYIAGCRSECCRRPRNRQLKAARVATLAGRQHWRTREEFEGALAPWLLLGLSRTAVCAAAGMKTVRAGQTGPVRAATYDAVARLTEDDLDGNSMVYADLTRRRVFSLMAAGHQHRDMPIAENGLWRTRNRIRVDLARRMRDHYQALEFAIGGARQTLSRARNAGHLPPLAWDDPGTLAWPHGAPELPEPAAGVGVDEVVVDRLLLGDNVSATRAERMEAMRRWLADGRSEKSLCERHGWKAGRYTPRQAGAA